MFVCGYREGTSHIHMELFIIYGYIYYMYCIYNVYVMLNHDERMACHTYQIIIGGRGEWIKNHANIKHTTLFLSCVYGV